MGTGRNDHQLRHNTPFPQSAIGIRWLANSNSNNENLRRATVSQMCGVPFRLRQELAAVFAVSRAVGSNGVHVLIPCCRRPEWSAQREATKQRRRLFEGKRGTANVPFCSISLTGSHSGAA
jgi:hypothetical protein